MEKYHKIQTIYKRDMQNNGKTLLIGDYSMPEFEYLKDNIWVWTEKIDGTNTRIKWDGQNVRFGGKTDSAQIPTNLLDTLQDTFVKDIINDTFPGIIETESKVCLYGEGYGAKIQKGGGNYIPDHADFILFDVKIDNWWLKRDAKEDIANKLGIKIVPIIGKGTLDDAIRLVKEGFTSKIAYNKDHMAEGLILTPEVELFNRKGERIITKIKHKDFR